MRPWGHHASLRLDQSAMPPPNAGRTLGYDALSHRVGSGRARRHWSRAGANTDRAARAERQTRSESAAPSPAQGHQADAGAAAGRGFDTAGLPEAPAPERPDGSRLGDVGADP